MWSNFMEVPADLLRAADESLYLAKRRRPAKASGFESDIFALES